MINNLEQLNQSFINDLFNNDLKDETLTQGRRFIKNLKLTSNNLSTHEIGISLSKKCITIPIRSIDNNIIGFYGKSFTNSNDIIVGSVNDTLYNLDNIKDKEIYLVSDIFDVFFLEKQGINNVVSCINAKLTNNQIKQLELLGVDTINLIINNQYYNDYLTNKLLDNNFNVNNYLLDSNITINEYFKNDNNLNDLLTTKKSSEEIILDNVLTYNQDVNKYENVSKELTKWFDKVDYKEVVENFDRFENGKLYDDTTVKHLYLDYLIQKGRKPIGEWCVEVFNQREFEKEDFLLYIEIKNSIINQNTKELIDLFLMDDDNCDDIINFYTTDNPNLQVLTKLLDYINPNITFDEVVFEDIVRPFILENPKVNATIIQLLNDNVCQLISNILEENNKIVEQQDKDNKEILDQLNRPNIIFSEKNNSNLKVINQCSKLLNLGNKEKEIYLYKLSNTILNKFKAYGGINMNNEEFGSGIGTQGMNSVNHSSGIDVPGGVQMPHSKEFNHKKLDFKGDVDKPLYNTNQVQIIGWVNNTEKNPLQLEEVGNGNVKLNVGIISNEDYDENNPEQQSDYTYATLWGEQAQEVFNKVVVENPNDSNGYKFKFNGVMSYKEGNDGKYYPSLNIKKVSDGMGLPEENTVLVQGELLSNPKQTYDVNNNPISLLEIVDKGKFEDTNTGETKYYQHLNLAFVNGEEFNNASMNQDIQFKAKYVYNFEEKKNELQPKEIKLGLTQEQKEQYFQNKKEVEIDEFQPQITKSVDNDVYQTAVDIFGQDENVKITNKPKM